MQKRISRNRVNMLHLVVLTSLILISFASLGIAYIVRGKIVLKHSSYSWVSPNVEVFFFDPVIAGEDAKKADPDPPKYWEGRMTASFTDSDGTFESTSIPAGTYYLVIYLATGTGLIKKLLLNISPTAPNIKPNGRYLDLAPIEVVIP
jgi:hypothetical protein